MRNLLDVSIEQPRVRAATMAARVGSAPRAVWFTYAVLGALLLAYFASLIVRGPGQSVTLVDGWLVAAFEMVASVLVTMMFQSVAILVVVCVPFVERTILRRPGAAAP